MTKIANHSDFDHHIITLLDLRGLRPIHKTRRAFTQLHYIPNGMDGDCLRQALCYLCLHVTLVTLHYDVKVFSVVRRFYVLRTNKIENNFSKILALSKLSYFCSFTLQCLKNDHQLEIDLELIRQIENSNSSALSS